MVDIHADDYAYSLNTSIDILECLKKGKLNSFSIICNTIGFEDSMELLYSAIPSLPFLPNISIHLNLPEGKGITDLLPTSWAKLFLASYSFNKKAVKEKLKKELKWQIDTTQKAIGKCIEIAKANNIECKQKGIRIDSHIHTHPIPIVWGALLEVIEDEKYEIEFIRNPKEPIIPFLKRISLIPSYGLANIIKNRILMLYSKKIDNYCDLHKIDKMYMWGLMMSGHMDFDRVNALYDDMIKKANADNRNLELLFHPGMAKEDEYSEEMDKSYFVNANLSKNRHIEKHTVMSIEDIMEQNR